MAIAVIGGVVSSTLLSLVVIPVLYLAIENAKATLGRWFRPAASTNPAAAPGDRQVDAELPLGGHRDARDPERERVITDRSGGAAPNQSLACFGSSETFSATFPINNIFSASFSFRVSRCGAHGFGG